MPQSSYNVDVLETIFRSPDGDERGPWCFTDIDLGAMQYCDIPLCGQYNVTYKFNLIRIEAFSVSTNVIVRCVDI